MQGGRLILELSEKEVNQTLRQLARKMGQENASKLLSALGRDKQFLNAIETPVGQELLKDAANNIEDKLTIWLQGKDTPEDKAEVKAYLKIINKWQMVINRYYKNKEKFTKSVA
jgi:hypothetical protein